MNLPEGAIPTEQWKPDPLKIVSIIAEIIGRRDGVVCEVVNKDGSPINGG